MIHGFPIPRNWADQVKGDPKEKSPAAERFRQLAAGLPDCGENYGYTMEEMDELDAKGPSADHQPG